MITTRRNFVRTASVLAIANVAHGANLPLQQDIPIQSGPFSAEGSFGSRSRMTGCCSIAIRT